MKIREIWKAEMFLVGLYLSQGGSQARTMKKMKTLLGLMAIGGLGSWAHAGDALYGEAGGYAGTANKTFWQTKTGSYGGSIFKNGCLSDSSGRYAGKINANGSITRADGSYGGFVSGWDADGE